ncbi:hypothetical protein [Nocardioides sp. LHG3406-4]|uniref:hypothetical protein n=1 Tax=Nocardioides sp. LHG3406-4 TaxID=2804575 RepID=UPI003CE9324B
MIENFITGVVALWPLLALAGAVLMAAWAVDLHDRLNRTAMRLNRTVERALVAQQENEQLRADLRAVTSLRARIIALPPVTRTRDLERRAR